MRSILLYIILFSIAGCKEQERKTGSQVNKVESMDSFSVSNDRNKTLYVERARFELKNYSITVRSIFQIPDSLKYDSSYYFEGNFLFIYDNKTNHSDSLTLELPSYDPVDLTLEDFSDSLHFKTLLLCINWRGDSDQPGSEFVEYNGDSLRKLFTIDNLVSLARTDEWTLSGFVAGRDEVVYSGQSDYPLKISLKDYEVKITDPDKQSIGYRTVALADIKAYRDRRLNERNAYTIKKGRELVVDSIFRSLNLVRLIVADSITLYARPEVISNSVQQNAAG
ncbi:MAG: hypothetical protein ACHQFX_03425 [Chitinophagales bacterium]